MARERRRVFGVGKHYAMERFAIMSLLSFGLVMGLVIWGGVNTATASRVEDLTRVAYGDTSGFTSVTEAPWSFVGLYENLERDKAALLFCISDMSVMSRDAKTYDVRVVGFKDEAKMKPLEVPIEDAGCVVYGRTGYIVVTLDSSAQFARQLALVVVTDTTSRANSSDYDVWYQMVNFGADNAIETACFKDDGTFDAELFFQKHIAASTEETIRNTLGQDLTQMGDTLTSIHNLEAVVSDAGVDVKSFRPVWITGDYVEDDENDGKIRYTTPTVAQGGFDFDWVRGSISEGYLSDLVYAAGMTDAQEYLDAQVAAATPWTYERPNWTLSDGTVIPEVDDEGNITSEDGSVTSKPSSAVMDVARDVRNLDTAYATYADLKSKYQIDDLRSLLELELSVNDRMNAFSQVQSGLLSESE